MLNTEIQPAISAMSNKIAFHRIELILFDLDGTLVDSVGDLAWCGNEMLRALDMPLHDPQAARDWVGNGLERLVKRILTGDMDTEPDAALFRTGLDLFNGFYADHASDHSLLYPGAIDKMLHFNHIAHGVNVWVGRLHAGIDANATTRPNFQICLDRQLILWSDADTQND